jgi:hypothetical protein
VPEEWGFTEAHWDLVSNKDSGRIKAAGKIDRSNISKWFVKMAHQANFRDPHKFTGSVQDSTYSGSLCA